MTLPVRKFDAIIVGAGGAGMRCSLQLAEAGHVGTRRSEHTEPVDDVVGHEVGVDVAGPTVLVVVVPLTALDVRREGGGNGAGVAVAGVGVEEGWLPGRARIRRTLGMTGPSGRIPRVAPGAVVSGSFVSQHRLGAVTGWSVVYPGP